MQFNPGSQGLGLQQQPIPGQRETGSILNGELRTMSPESNMQAEMQILEAQYEGLQTLVGELLVTNQQLRMQVAELQRRLDPAGQATGQATHPQPRPGH